MGNTHKTLNFVSQASSKKHLPSKHLSFCYMLKNPWGMALTISCKLSESKRSFKRQIGLLEIKSDASAGCLKSD